MKIKGGLVLVSVFVILLCACNLPIAEPTVDPLAVQLAEMTIIAELTETAAIGIPPTGGEETEWFAPTDTPEPDATARPTSSPSPSESAFPTQGPPTVNVSVDTNCRYGPHIVYDYLGALLVGEQTTIVGRHAERSWLLVENPDRDGTCWLTMQYADVDGDLGQVPVVEAPTFYDWNGTWTFVQFQVVVDGNLTLVQTGRNVSGVLETGGPRMLYSGTLSDNGQLFSGTVQQEGSEDIYPIYFRMLENLNQFIGAENTGFAPLYACGYRNTAGYPGGCPLP